MRRLPHQSPPGLDKRNTNRSGGTLGESGAVWEMATTRLHNDVLLDSEECYERAFHCIFAYVGVNI